MKSTPRPLMELVTILVGRGAAPDLQLLLQARVDQLEKHGHSEAADDESLPYHLANVAMRLADHARTHLQHDRHFDLDVAERAAAKAGAMALALQRRIRTERAAIGGTHD